MSPADKPSAEAPRRRLCALFGDLRENVVDLAEHLLAHWRLILGLGAAALVGAVLFAWSGLYSVAATSGHYPFFRSFLEAVMDHWLGNDQAAGHDCSQALPV